MFANLTGLLPLISVASVLIVSANTIGYFARIGPHFLGLMDLTNFIYPLGLAFVGLMIVLQLLSIAHRVAMRWSNVDEFNPRPILLVTILLGFCLVLSHLLLHYSDNHHAFYELVAIAVIATWLAAVFGLIAFVNFHRSRGKIDNNVTMGFVLAVLSTSYLVGELQAHYQAFQTPTLYKITGKHGFDSVVRIIRASSSGLLVASTDRRIIFVPKEEYRQVEREMPINLDSSDW
jgi:hypothetical protein